MLHNGWGLNFLFYPVFPTGRPFNHKNFFFLMFKVASIFPKILFSPHVSYQPLPILLFYFNRKNFIELSAHTLFTFSPPIYSSDPITQLLQYCSNESALGKSHEASMLPNPMILVWSSFFQTISNQSFPSLELPDIIRS